MIDPTAVADAALARIVAGVAGGFPVADTTAPAPAPDVYVVLEWPAGGTRTGSLGAPEQHLTVSVRVRGVARSKTAATARRAAQNAAHRAVAALLDRSQPITGPGWTVGSREQISDAGTDLVGELANNVVDVELVAYPA